MNIVFTILAALPLGLSVKKRSAAVLAFVIADLFVFTFQTLDVLLNWMAGNSGIGGASAFGPHPETLPITYSAPDVIAYGVVNLVITLAGIGLVVLGNKIRTRRAATKDVVSVG